MSPLRQSLRKLTEECGKEKKVPRADRRSRNAAAKVSACRRRLDFGQKGCYQRHGALDGRRTVSSPPCGELLVGMARLNRVIETRRRVPAGGSEARCRVLRGGYAVATLVSRFRSSHALVAGSDELRNREGH